MSNSDLNNSITAPCKNSKIFSDLFSHGSGQFPNSKINDKQSKNLINISNLYSSKLIDNNNLLSTQQESWLKVINFKNSMKQYKQIKQSTQFKQIQPNFINVFNKNDENDFFPPFLPCKKQNQQQKQFPGLKKQQNNKNYGLYEQLSKSFNIRQSEQFNLYDKQPKQQQISLQTKGQQYDYKNILKQLYNQQYMNYNGQNRFSKIQKVNFIRDTYNRQSILSYNIIRQPIIFKKRSEGFRPANRLSGNYLCRLIDNRIYYKNVQIQNQLLNNQQFVVNCNFIQIDKNEFISPSLQIDSQSQRLFYYSNTRQQIVIISLSSNKKKQGQICRIDGRSQRQNPILYLISIANKKILLIIGGYRKINNCDQVQGCKQIQLFYIDNIRQTISKSRIIKLLNGRIFPLIISPTKIQLTQSILLIGGNTIGKIINKENIKQSQIVFNDPKIIKINRSSNVQGVYITTKQILQCINYQNDINLLPQLNNVTVQVDDKIQFLRGHVDYVKLKQNSNKLKILLFLPKQSSFYTMKIVKKQVKVTKYNSKTYFKYNKQLFQPKLSYQLLEMKNINSIGFQYYQINQKTQCKRKLIGSLNLDKCFTKNIQCNICEFM